MKSTVFKSNHVLRLKFTSFSEEHATSIFRVKEQVKQTATNLFDSKDGDGSFSETLVNVVTMLHGVTSKKILLFKNKSI
jgi:hypothetical protein